MRDLILDLRKYLVTLLPIAICVIATNLTIDPGAIFQNRSLEKQILNSLKQGQNAAFAITMSQLDETYIIRHRIAEMPDTPEIVVLGSSRSFPISSEFFVHKKFYNASISSASFADYLAIFNILEKSDHLPRTIIMDLDPDQFVLPIEAKENLFQDYKEMSKKIGLINTKQEILLSINHEYNSLSKKIQGLLSPSYFQYSIKYFLIKNNLIRIDGTNLQEQDIKIFKQTWWPTLEQSAPGGVIFPDGSREWSSRELKMDHATKEKQILFNMSQMKRLKKHDQELQHENIVLFEKFLQYILYKKVNLVLYLPPHHHYLYNYELQHYQRPVITESEKFIKELANKYHLRVFGSFDPNVLSFNDADFVDHHHLTQLACFKIFKQAHKS